MHGQNINLPVCVCVCLCVCLSVCVCIHHTLCQLAYRSDPSTDLRRDVPFGGLDTFSGQKSPKTPILGPE